MEAGPASGASAVPLAAPPAVAPAPPMIELPVLSEPTCGRRRPARCRMAGAAGNRNTNRSSKRWNDPVGFRPRRRESSNMTPRQIGYALRKHNIPIKKF